MERLLQILDIRHSGRELNLERKRHPCGVERGKSRADVPLGGATDPHESGHGRIAHYVYESERPFPIISDHWAIVTLCPWVSADPGSANRSTHIPEDQRDRKASVIEKPA